MRLINIIKHFRNGTISHSLIIPSAECENNFEDNAHYLAEEWCRNESSGQNTGYSWDWEEITDAQIISEIFEEKYYEAERKLKHAQQYRNEIFIKWKGIKLS